MQYNRDVQKADCGTGSDMGLRGLHDIIWGDGYELCSVDDELTDPTYVGHFGYDDTKPKAYLDCTVTGVTCAEGKLEVAATDNNRKSFSRTATYYVVKTRLAH